MKFVAFALLLATAAARAAGPACPDLSGAYAQGNHGRVEIQQQGCASLTYLEIEDQEPYRFDFVVDGAFHDTGLSLGTGNVYASSAWMGGSLIIDQDYQYPSVSELTRWVLTPSPNGDLQCTVTARNADGSTTAYPPYTLQKLPPAGSLPPR